MKRSQINEALREMERMCARCGFCLPPFCSYTPEEWRFKGKDHDEIRDNMLGWDITDYGLGDFDRVGFSLITIRNGNLKRRDQYKKTYAEKLLYLKEGQYSPNHFHWKKMEDIIKIIGRKLEGVERITSIKVRRRSDNSKGIVISVEVVLYYGVKLFAVTKQFQAKIKEKIEYMTAMKVNNVNVSIRSLAVKK